MSFLPGAGRRDDEAETRHPALRSAYRHLADGDAKAALGDVSGPLDADDTPSGPLLLVAGLAEAALGHAAAARSRLLAAAAAGQDLVPAEWPRLIEAAIQCCDLDADGATLDAALRVAIEAHPDRPETYMARGDLYRARGGLENAINEYDYAAELDEKLAEAWVALAECELAQGRPLDASDALDHAADLDPNDINLFVRMGDALLDAGDPARAIRAYEEGLELAPENPDLFRGRARASLAMQLFEDAIEDCRSAVARAPGDAAAWYLLGVACYQLGDDVTAVDALSRVIEIEPQHGAASRARADAHWARRDFRAAEADYARALALQPEDAELQLCLAEARFELGDSEGALSAALDTVTARPELADGYVLAAKALGAHGDLDTACAILDRGIEQVADYPELYVQRARLQRAARRLNLAWRDLRWAIDLDPGHAEAYLLRGQVALELEGPEEALADLDAAIEIDPDGGGAYAWRGRALSLSGDAKAAETDWAAAESLLPPEDATRDLIAVWRRGDD